VAIRDNAENAGAMWHRWDPHIHSPGTVLNDQFSGANKWEEYLATLESKEPVIRALGVTDYYGTATYEQVVAHHAAGRLKNCDLIFPNVELRLDVATGKERQVNIHLLVSPEDDNHLEELNRVLRRIVFKVPNDEFTCTKSEFVRLGKTVNADASDAEALQLGTLHFKVSIDNLRAVLKDSAWARKNILVAISGSGTDGSSGVNGPADGTLRRKLEECAHLIFASSQKQAEFWAGNGKAPREELEDGYGGLKPCLHGSDAHHLKTVGEPDENRFTWIKGAVHFDALRQACIDPENRAFVGETPPGTAPESQIISSIKVTGAPWAKTPKLLINPGLVAIIGARGSGKTALADMIALGCDAMPEDFDHESLMKQASFLHRAKPLLGDQTVTLEWMDGESDTRKLDRSDLDQAEYPRARYLSQKFVETLCSAEGVTDELQKEIERVIFDSHSSVEREGTTEFQELLDLRADRSREAREREELNIAEISDQIGTEHEKQVQAKTLEKGIAEKADILKRLKREQQTLAVKGGKERVERLSALNEAQEKVREKVRFYALEVTKLQSLQDEVANVRDHGAREALRESQETYKDAHLEPEEWEQFLMDYTGEVDVTLADKLKKAQDQTEIWKGKAPPQKVDLKESYVTNDADLEKLSLAILAAEIGRLVQLVASDKQTQNKLADNAKKLSSETSAKTKLEERLVESKAAAGKIETFISERQLSYEKVFDAVIAEQTVLSDLYKPLTKKLELETGTLKKLSFSVHRIADIDTWAANGESLLDLRRIGPLKGTGALKQSAKRLLKSAWESGSAKEAASAMAEFRRENEMAFLKQAKEGDPATLRAWTKRFAKWWYGTDHISIEYTINYDGIDIRKHSPGTRGIVLLMLYLALDDGDDRPLIIDQPEENLDPKSIFDELVNLFIKAKTKRQVIMVTHNANLVVNTDADQVIVAEVGPASPGQLPPISYKSGGLDEADIRIAVCNILEGGEPAFKQRARRLRVSL
jgi:hypothetical protein